jgi:hypothetical protein
MSQESPGDIKENGELLGDYCSNSSLTVGGTIFLHKKIHKAILISEQRTRKIQELHVRCQSNEKSSCRV